MEMLRSMSAREYMEWRALYTVRNEELAQHQAKMEAQARSRGRG